MDRGQGLRGQPTQALSRGDAERGSEFKYKDRNPHKSDVNQTLGSPIYLNQMFRVLTPIVRVDRVCLALATTCSWDFRNARLPVRVNRNGILSALAN